ncbi:MAG: sulfotransferase [Rhodothermales bacterium]|nr:sulfotransferase [Rhodothermales bacterium]
MRKPDFFIVGAPKCGTTALYQYLRAHPDVYMPRKEFHHFGRDLRPEGYAGERWDRAAYLALFDGCTTERRCGEDSTWYLFSKTAAREIHAFNPDADVLINLRDPVEMMYSLYALYVWFREPTPYGVYDEAAGRLLSFEEALDTQEARKEAYQNRIDEAALAGQRVSRLFHTDAAMYAAQVERYLDVFGPAHVHITFFDDLKRDAAGTYRAVLDFLGVDPTFQPEFRVHNSNRQVRSYALHRLLNDWDALGGLRRAARVLVPKRLRRGLVGAVLSANTRHQPRPPMRPETRQRLQTHFRPDVERLGALLGEDLVARWFGTAEPAPLAP